MNRRGRSAIIRVTNAEATRERVGGASPQYTTTMQRRDLFRSTGTPVEGSSLRAQKLLFLQIAGQATAAPNRRRVTSWADQHTTKWEGGQGSALSASQAPRAKGFREGRERRTTRWQCRHTTTPRPPPTPDARDRPPDALSPRSATNAPLREQRATTTRRAPSDDAPS